MTNLPSGGNWPYLDLPSLQALKEDHERLRYTAHNELAQLRHFLNELNDEGGGATAVAITQQIIPPRVGKTPGGPVTVTIQQSVPEGSDFTDGDQVDIYSWVQSPSGDPATQPGGILYIYICQDRDGVWWFVAQDCTQPAVQVVEQTGTDVDPIPPAPGASLGLGFTVDSGDYGIWQMTGGVTLDLSGIGNNQDVGVRVYATLDGVEVGPGITTWFYRSSGAVADVPFTVYFDIDASDEGKTFDVLVERLSSQTTLVAENPAAQFLGPL